MAPFERLELGTLVGILGFIGKAGAEIACEDSVFSERITPNFVKG